MIGSSAAAATDRDAGPMSAGKAKGDAEWIGKPEMGAGR